jgi:hypothetical protein
MSDAIRRGRRWRRRHPYRWERPWSEDEVAEHWATLDDEPTTEPDDIDMPYRYSARQRDLTPNLLYCWCGEEMDDNETCPLDHPDFPEEEEEEDEEVMYLVRLFDMEEGPLEEAAAEEEEEEYDHHHLARPNTGTPSERDSSSPPCWTLSDSEDEDAMRARIERTVEEEWESLRASRRAMEDQRAESSDVE